MEYETKALNVYRQGEEISDQFYIDDDVNVPDIKRDVLQVILGEGKLCVEELQMVENYLRITGKLKFRVLYAAEAEQMCLESLEGWFPFEEMVHAAGISEDSFFVKSTQAELSVNMIHSRKLNIKTLAEIVVCPSGEENITFVTDIQASVPLYKKYRKEEILSLVRLKNDVYRVREELALTGTKESIGNLLWTEVSCRRADSRVADGELLLQGELAVFCFYESMEGKIDWLEESVSFQGSISCPGIAEGMYHQLYHKLTDVIVEPRMDENGEMRLLGIDAALEVRMMICAEEELTLLEDVYALTQECNITYAHQEPEHVLMQNNSKCKIAERLSLPEIKDEILQICHSSAGIRIENIKTGTDGLDIEGFLYLSFLYIQEDDGMPFNVWQGMVPFSYLLKCNEMARRVRYDIDGCVEQLSVNLLGSEEVEVKAVLAFNCFVRETVEISNIQEVEMTPINMEELEKAPGIIGYICKEGEEIWNLAKKYNTTVDGIMDVNEKEDESLKNGEKLLIFKENMSIL